MAAENSSYSALLIGSWEYDGERETSGGDKKMDSKGGIRRTLAKNNKQLRGKWAIGDLNNMEAFIKRKEIDVFHTLHYVEQAKNGTYGLGKKEILPAIDVFFKQDKTRFVLYFTGHGAREDGSWCFAVRRTFTAEETAAMANGTDKPTESVCAIETQTKVNDESETDEDETQPLPAHEQPAGQADLGVGVAPADPDIESVASLDIKDTSNQPKPDKKWNDFVSFEEVLEKWDENKKGRDRYLMLILDCCHAGKWVDMVNALTIETAQGRVKRRDICVQAACRPAENSMVANNQRSSVFTRGFIAAQSKSPLEKLVLSAIDHALVLNIVSIACSPIRHPFTPISSDLAPFGDIRFFDSFDEMFSV